MSCCSQLLFSQKFARGRVKNKEGTKHSFIIAYFFPSDRQSQHVKEADEAVGLGPIAQEGGNPHLNISLLIKTALSVGADSIHPGYGYLSENADFARQTLEAGLIFVGPSPRAISVLGDKRAAKEYLTKHEPHIPLIPGYNGKEQDPTELRHFAERIGYPILIKASAGGGGKGMRIVREPKKFEEELLRAQSEAQRSFGSSQCILERYIDNGKHVEIQIVGDNHGTVKCLFDRDCSIQRRHQKIIEEAPCPWLSSELRNAMCAAAMSIGQLLNYDSAGTIEFMVDIDSKEFFFLEMNTRIQVEHCITEEITAVDIVSLQIYIASNGRLSELRPLDNSTIMGHSIECRLCAEDPARGFLAISGKIWRWTPATAILQSQEMENVRFETAIQSGCDISVHFDSMIAKVVVWAPTRALAISKMLKVLSHTICMGISTNQLFLQSCLLHPSFHQDDYCTGFIVDNLNVLLRNPYMKEAAHDWQRRLGAVASYAFRHLIPAASLPLVGGRQHLPFANIPLRFRNQKKDLGVGQSDVICILTSIEPTVPLADQIIVFWLRDSSVPNDDTHMVQVETFESLSPPGGDNKGNPVLKNTKPEFQLAAQYHRIAAALTDRSGVTKRNFHILKVQGSRLQDLNNPKGAPFADIDLELDSERFSVYSAAIIHHSNNGNANSRGGVDRLLVHIPKLGSWVEYSRQSLLQFCESLRLTDETGPSSGGGLKAPMPCKALKILRENGAKVSKGDSLLIIESMKTEIKIIAEKDGSFTSLVKEGDAVDEGTLLCMVD